MISMRPPIFGPGSLRAGSIIVSIIVAVLIAGINQHTIAAERPYYMWVDENGVLNYSQEKPKDTEAEEIYGRPSTRPGTPGQDEQPKLETLPGNAPVLDEEEIEAVNEKARLLNCEIGRRMSAKLNEHKFIYMQDEDGWWRKLSPEQFAAQVERANDLIAEYCPGS